MDPAASGRVEPVAHGSSDDFDLLDLSANVNPRTPEGVRAVYVDALGRARRYPPTDYPDYRRAAAAHAGCDPGQVIPTAGGLAAIRLAIEVTVEPGDDVLVPYPSFGEYAREVRLQGATPRFVAHDAIHETDPADCALAIRCTPNNPTGEATPPDRLRAFIERCGEVDTPVLVDEAFLGFTDHESVAGTENAMVARSLTKLFGLPGLRAGFAVASGDLRTRLRNAVPPWALGTPAARVGTHCMESRAFVHETRERVATERTRLRAGLPDSVATTPGVAPFVLCDVAGTGYSAAEFVSAVREHDVFLRDATTFRGLDTHVRIAVRTSEATDRLLSVLETVLDDDRSQR